MGCSRLPGLAFRASADLPDRALAVPWFARPAHAPPVFAACRKIQGPWAQKESVPSAQVLYFDTRESAPLLRPAVRPGSRPHCVVGSTSDARVRLRSHSSRQRSPDESPVPDRLRFARIAFANDFSKIRASRIGDDHVRDAMPAGAHPQQHNSRTYPGYNRSEPDLLLLPLRGRRDLNKTPGYAGENCGPSRVDVPF